MIELVDRLEAEDERRMAVLLENHCGGQRSFQAMRGAMPDHAAKTSKRRAAWRRFRVVGKVVQEPLYGERRSQSLDDSALGARERRDRGRLSAVQPLPSTPRPVPLETTRCREGWRTHAPPYR